VNDKDSLAAGFGRGLLLHVPGQLVLVLLATAFYGRESAMLPLLFCGWTQLVYMVPAGIWYARKGRRKTASAIAILAAILFLATSACAGLMYRSL